MHAFNPFPLLGNAHVQTVLANLATGGVVALPSTPVLVPLADGDGVVIHDSVPPTWQEGAVALLVHGLGGCHQSGYICRITDQLTDAGVRVYRMDMRGCGAGAAHAQRMYSAACSGDVRTVLALLNRRHPRAPLLLAGFSLGAAVVLKMVGEAGDTPPAGLCAVTALAPPLDLLLCSGMIARMPVYHGFFLYHLLRQVRRHQQRMPHLPRIQWPRRLTLRQFDDLYTAPQWGFANVDDYYERASALPWVAKIRVPTFVLAARDDPFIAVAPFEALAPSPWLEVHITERGGHLGFLGPDGHGGRRWAERQIVNWLLAQTRRVVAPTAGVDNDQVDALTISAT